MFGSPVQRLAGWNRQPSAAVGDHTTEQRIVFVRDDHRDHAEVPRRARRQAAIAGLVHVRTYEWSFEVHGVTP
ncbi:hypothetical protein ACXJJ3_31360 [Kribbella sp. WER1]